MVPNRKPNFLLFFFFTSGISEEKYCAVSFYLSSIFPILMEEGQICFVVFKCVSSFQGGAFKSSLSEQPYVNSAISNFPLEIFIPTRVWGHVLD